MKLNEEVEKMSQERMKPIEETLDPADWESMRALGHRMVDDMLTYLQNVRSVPSGFPTKEAIEDICVPLTDDGDGEEKVYEVFQHSILPFTFPITRPRFWALVAGTGSPFGMFAEMLRAGTNSGQEALLAEAHVHTQVISWIKEMIGYPEEGGGVLVGGGSEANFTGLAVARNTKAEVDMKAEGVQRLGRRMTLYCSDETHHCLERSVELLGLGNEALRWIPTDNQCRIRLAALKKAIDDDRKQNNHPFCIIGCAGTVNSGAFDDLNALADLAEAENMWFHVDGAFGAWALWLSIFTSGCACPTALGAPSSKIDSLTTARLSTVMKPSTWNPQLSNAKIK
jgi:hypothetical protein